jgi:hypothetical protein
MLPSQYTRQIFTFKHNGTHQKTQNTYKPAQLMYPSQTQFTYLPLLINITHLKTQ